MPVGDLAQEVRGVFFASARRYLVERHGAEALERVLAAIEPAHRRALERPEPDEFYPEQAWREVLHALNDQLAGGDPEKFVQIVHDSSSMGIRLFVHVVLRLASTTAVLRRTPKLWARMRRGPATLSVEEAPDRIRLRYARYPLLSDPLYPLMLKGLVGALSEASAGYVPPIRVVDRGPDWLVLEVTV